jgi:DNA-binding MarR family transcriptional regulator
MNELAKRTSLGKSTLTSMLDRLEESGYIRRVRSTEDRRVVSVHRTMKDESFRRAFLQLSAEMIDEWYRGFSRNERAQFETFLRRILANLEKGT